VCCEHVLTTGRPFPVETVESEDHLALDPVPASVSRARSFVLHQLGDTDRDVRDVVALLTSELVTNGVLHARTPLLLGVTRARDHFLVALADQLPAHPRPQPRSSTRLGGRGLALIEDLAAEWGTVPTADGKVVWFSVARDAVRRAG
jgi:anti-sigma regulatory factor (Ser/Thr protein kinase)